MIPGHQNLETAMRLAIEEAERFVGATAPNPPVGAVVLSPEGDVLAVAAHERAGTAHAEVLALERARSGGVEADGHTLVVTLEPCHHFGKTPPCTQAILKSSIKRVVFGVSDPHRAAQGGGDFLQKNQIDVDRGFLQEECEALMRGFLTVHRLGRPWVTIKTAHLSDGKMIPLEGQKTFTSEKSLLLAHQLRKRSDAIVTGSGTILADQPLFTVRRVNDHFQKKRSLVIFDRRKRVPNEYLHEAKSRGFNPLSVDGSIDSVLKFLAKEGVLEVLLEAGPQLSEAFLKTSLWDEHIRITQGNPDDQVETFFPV